MPSKYLDMTMSQFAQFELFYTKSLYERGLIELRAEVEQCEQTKEPIDNTSREEKQAIDEEQVHHKTIETDADQDDDCPTPASDDSEYDGETDDETLDGELQEHADLSGPQCPRCSRSFLDPTALASHVTVCRVHCRQLCSNCGRPFASRMQRDRHMREAHGLASVWQCPHCDAGHFYTEKGRDFHIYKSHPRTLSEADRAQLEEKYAQTCGMCDFVSWSKKTLQVHRRSGHFGIDWSTHCPACACGVKDSRDLGRHVEQKHAQDPNWYVCLICLRAISRLGDDDAVGAHRSLHEQNSGETCQECGKVFESSELLAFHQLKAHQGPLNAHHCGVCDLPQRDYRHLVFHMSTHKNKGTLASYDEAAASTRCPATGSAGDSGVAGVGTVGTSKGSTFMCRECNRSYEAESQLIAHQVWVHQGCEDDRYPCPFCGKPFTRQTYLALHLRRHVDERPYQCEHCGKSFAHLASLRGHVTMKHTKDFRFRCPICDKGFVSRVKTLIHLEQAHHYSSAGARLAMGEGQEQGSKDAAEVEEVDCEPSLEKAKNSPHNNDAHSTDSTTQFEDERPSYSDLRTLSEGHDEAKRGQLSSRSTPQHCERSQGSTQSFMTVVAAAPSDTVSFAAIDSVGECEEMRRTDGGSGGPVEISEHSEDADLPTGGEVILNHADGSQSLVRLQPGQQLLLEDENGVKQVIDYNDVVASAAVTHSSHDVPVEAATEDAHPRFPLHDRD